MQGSKARDGLDKVLAFTSLQSHELKCKTPVTYLHGHCWPGSLLMLQGSSYADAVSLLTTLAVTLYRPQYAYKIYNTCISGIGNCYSIAVGAFVSACFVLASDPVRLSANNC